MPDIVKSLRGWTQGGNKDAGVWGRDEARNLTGKITLSETAIVDTQMWGDPLASALEFSGALYMDDLRTAATVDSGANSPNMYKSLVIDASRAVPTGPQNVPQHVWQPAIIYLGTTEK